MNEAGRLSTALNDSGLLPRSRCSAAAGQNSGCRDGDSPVDRSAPNAGSGRGVDLADSGDSRHSVRTRPPVNLFPTTGQTLNYKSSALPTELTRRDMTSDLGFYGQLYYPDDISTGLKSLNHVVSQRPVRAHDSRRDDRGGRDGR